MCETKTRGTFVGEVVSNERLCEDHYRLVLRVGGFPPSQPGQFVQLQCRGLTEQIGRHVVEWPEGRPPEIAQPELSNREPFLRRPLSLAGRRDDDLEIIHLARGAGTRWLATVKPRGRLSVLGPLGNGMTMPAGKTAALLVGGGVGIPPMIYQAAALAQAGKRAVAFNGARTASRLLVTVSDHSAVSPDGEPTLCADEFNEWNVPSAIATDDGSLGYRGFVSDPLERWLDRTDVPASEIIVYCCGPEPLMQAAAAACIRRNIDCRLALERHMACGMGTCQSCIVKIRDDSAERGWSYKLCCTDGPVFDARDVLW